MNYFKYLTNQLRAINRIVHNKDIDPHFSLLYDGKWIASIECPLYIMISEYSYEELMISVHKEIKKLIHRESISYDVLHYEIKKIDKGEN